MDPRPGILAPSAAWRARMTFVSTPRAAKHAFEAAQATAPASVASADPSADIDAPQTTGINETSLRSPSSVPNTIVDNARVNRGSVARSVITRLTCMCLNAAFNVTNPSMNAKANKDVVCSSSRLFMGR